MAPAQRPPARENRTHYRDAVVSRCGCAACAAPGPVIVPPAVEDGCLSALASIEASSSSDMFFLNDLMPLAKSPIRLLTLPPPNSSRTTSSTTSQCQMLKLPINPPWPDTVAAQYPLYSARPGMPTKWRARWPDASVFRARLRRPDSARAASAEHSAQND